jgi:hypothetical protein
MPNMSGEIDYKINLLCLDGIDLSELLAAPVEYYDGLRDNWGEMPKEIRQLQQKISILPQRQSDAAIRHLRPRQRFTWPILRAQLPHFCFQSSDVIA